MNRSERRLSCLALATALTLTLVAGSALAAVPYSEDWSAGDTNGWIQGTISTVVVRDGGFGNPAGSLAIRRDLSGPIFPLSATTALPQASGDYTSAWMVSFDVFYDTGNYVDAWLRFRYQDASFDGWHLDVADAFPSSWESYSVMFDPDWSDLEAAANGWIDETGGTVSWQQLMTNVFHPEIRLLLGDDMSAAAHIDNFVLKVPEPATLALLAVALAGVGFSRRRKLH